MSDLISRSALIKAICEQCRSEKECINHFWYDENIISLITNAPAVKPCDNCDLYFKAMTKEAQKGERK